MALLYEKIKILQSSLSRGQSQYRDRLNEIRILRIKLADLNRELTILKRSVADVNVLKREVHSLGRQLLQECTKVKALSEELENPLNVHRSALHSHAYESMHTLADPMGRKIGLGMAIQTLRRESVEGRSLRVSTCFVPAGNLLPNAECKGKARPTGFLVMTCTLLANLDSGMVTRSA